MSTRENIRLIARSPFLDLAADSASLHVITEKK